MVAGVRGLKSRRHPRPSSVLLPVGAPPSRLALVLDARTAARSVNVLEVDALIFAMPSWEAFSFEPALQLEQEVPGGLECLDAHGKSVIIGTLDGQLLLYHMEPSLVLYSRRSLGCGKKPVEAVKIIDPTAEGASETSLARYGNGAAGAGAGAGEGCATRSQVVCWCYAIRWCGRAKSRTGCRSLVRCPPQRAA